MKVKRPELSLLKKIFLVDLIKGLLLTFSYQAPSKNYTEQYPKGASQGCGAFPRLPALEQRSGYRRDACASPAICALWRVPNIASKSVGNVHRTGKKALTTYIFDISRCMFCGLCEDACPTPCLELTQEFELSLYGRRDMKMDRQQLEEGVQPVVYTR